MEATESVTRIVLHSCSSEDYRQLCCLSSMPFVEACAPVHSFEEPIFHIPPHAAPRAVAATAPETLAPDIRQAATLVRGIAGGGAKRSRLRAESEETQARGTGVRLGQASGGNVADEISRADAGGVDVPLGGECAESAAHPTFAGGRDRVKQETPVLGKESNLGAINQSDGSCSKTVRARPQLQKTTCFSAACSAV